MMRKETKMLIFNAIRLSAAGHPYSAIAERLGSTKWRIAWFRKTYRDLWDDLLRKEQDAIVAAVRAAAGTSAALEDAARYLALAEAAQKITDDRGESLFVKSKEATLSQFFEGYYLATSNAGKDAVYQLRLTINRWVLYSADPPLREIDSAMLGGFKKFLFGQPGLHRNTFASARTVAGKLKHLQGVLDKAGPSGPRNRDGANILERVPWVRPPKVPQPIPDIVSDEHLGACYRAAERLGKPVIDGVETVDWWRALLVVAFNTGLRRGTLFSLRMADIDWEGERLVIPASRMKSARAHIVHLNKTALDHLQNIRTDRDLVFPWPGNDRKFFVWFHKLQDLAGIPKEEHFGLHAIRRTTATKLWENDPQAAQLALGHVGSDVTLKHYVQSAGIVQRALDALPQPEAFGAKAG